MCTRHDQACDGGKDSVMTMSGRRGTCPSRSAKSAINRERVEDIKGICWGYDTRHATRTMTPTSRTSAGRIKTHCGTEARLSDRVECGAWGSLAPAHTCRSWFRHVRAAHRWVVWQLAGWRAAFRKSSSAQIASRPATHLRCAAQPRGVTGLTVRHRVWGRMPWSWWCPSSPDGPYCGGAHP